MLGRTAAAAATILALVVGTAHGETAGITESEVKIGATFPFSGPASPLSNTGKGLIAYVNSVNDRGGINGRKINLITYDDAYSPPKTVEQTRKLIESDEVAFLFGPLGTPGISATIKYVNAKKVPHLFVVSGVTKFANFAEFPMTTTGLPSYTTEGRIYARYIAQTQPNAKVAILYQNDDLGKDFINAFKGHLKDDFDKKVIASSYEVSEPTIDSHVVSLKSSGAEVFLFAGTPKFAAQAIKKTDEIGWKPLFLINLVSTSVSSTIVPAGPEKAVGIIAATMLKDPGDKKWADDPGMKWYREHFAKYLPGADIGDANYLFGTQQGQILEQVLKQCGNDLSRENILKQARSIRGLSLPTLIPGITANTGPDNSMAYTQLQLQRWTGSSWEQFGEVLSGEQK
ncbi:ABC transporter substrate-binding protein [Bradyrhizobium sp. JYMT SZCCT0180]|uniref:ABC transporter substrate-binding protein n=1 Tax=Bradyrhizobium sp. JYMT SZCCT0180 TaxID=2807666 RepID=UPI001BA513DC|nr:ABC transporter substrate-binding protein [Bradyrhizobium sp. JYMT SZCCT0180]MBR1215652.1 ABC transporter substrate-binding protein [Bradyrhizobium sp. JYMT SZCCT0180]